MTEGELAKQLARQLSHFLTLKRDGATYAEFSRRLGLPASTLFRLENQQQSITLNKLAKIMVKLRTSLAEIFPRAGE
jgi:transcriptional regulator with XRE-family HTH domain